MNDHPSIVVDSSVILKWLARQDEQNLVAADLLLERIVAGSVAPFIPELARYEVSNALLKGKKLAFSQAKKALSFFYSLPLECVPHSEELADLTYRRAESSGMTIYDAAFVVLAEVLHAPLITDNLRHQGRGEMVTVIPLSSYC